ncbi:hypothetical protein KAU11_10370 [Candidatus Babeliales bacterium]|nr:hypothetical protein [Candidatus Babeliales bacterium]
MIDFQTAKDRIESNLVKDMLTELYFMEVILGKNEKQLEEWLGSKGIDKTALLKEHKEQYESHQETLNNLIILEKYMKDGAMSDFKIVQEVRDHIKAKEDEVKNAGKKTKKK